MSHLAWFGALVTGAAALTVGKSNIVPGAYIAEFEDTASSSAFYSNLTASKIDATPRITLDHQLFNGVSFKLAAAHDSEDTVDTIQSMAIVKKIWPLRTYSHPGNAAGGSSGLASLSSALRKRSTEEAGEFLGKRDSADTWSTHVMGGVSGLRDEGYTGEGIFVGVVDTGVDWSHPALGGCFGPGCKVVTGYDLVGPDYNGTNTPVPGPGVTDCQGHGTHVSGIIGANPNPYNFTGVIPNATLGMWKVFSCVDSVGDDVLINAFNAAYEAGVDVISSSIGGPSGWTENPWDVAVQRIVEKGVPCILAAGNDGVNGMFDTSEASEGIGAVSVGSVDNTYWPAFLTTSQYLVNGADETEFGYAIGAYGDFGTVDLPLYAISFDTTDPVQACSALPSTTPDLSGYIVLIRRGTCAFDDKIANAVAFGAKRILFYNNVPGEPTQPGDTSKTIPVAQVSDVLGAHWISLLAAGDNVTIEFITQNETTTHFEMPLNYVTPGKMSTYTSWGPTYEMYIKPQVSAPGGYILSTWPVDLGSYASISGTSMATPFIAGVVGLLKQVKGKSISPGLLTILLATTASPITWNTGSATNYTNLAPVIQQGGGLVNAYKAAYTTTILDTPNINLNDTTHFTAAHTISITNTGSTAVTYQFTNIAASTGYTLDSDSVWPAAFPPAIDASAAKIRFVPSSLTVPAGATLPVVLHFTRPSLNESLIPVYSGYVGITGSNGESVTLPYAGAASELKHATVTDYPDGFPYLSIGTGSADDALDPITEPTTFIMDGSGYPTIVWVLAMGSPIVRVDIVPEDVHGLPRILGQQVLGSMAGYPSIDNYRAAVFSSPWDGTLADGSLAPAGTYKFLYRALKIFGDETYDHDYEAYSTPYFTIQY